MRILRLIAFCLLATVVFAPRTVADVSAEERKQAFEWFDSLGYPPITTLPLVKVYDGSWTEDDFPKRTPTYEYGFLTASDGKHFSVCLLTLEVESLTISPRTKESDPLYHERIYFEAIDLQEYAHLLIKQIADGKGPLFSQEAGLSITLLVLARACKGHGLTDLAAQLFNLAIDKMPIGKQGDPKRTFLERIGNEISRGVIWRLTLEFEDPKIPRSALLPQYDAFLAHFPSSEYRELALDTDTELKRMVTEDQELAARPAVPHGQVSQQSRIADLVFALRDQNGQQFEQPGECDVFADPRGEKSPASQLVKIGFPAAPALLEELTDSRLTRSVEFGRSFFFSHRVLRVGDVAKVVLEKITERSFESRPELKWSSHWKERAASIQNNARTWWAQVQSKGEAQVLVEAVRRGDSNSVGQAERLVKMYPRVALPALVMGIKHTHEAAIRQGLVQDVGELHRPEVLPVLETQMRSATDLGTRVEAAYGVHARGGADAVTCMIQEWQKRPQIEPMSSPLLNFLVYCGSLDALRVLEEGLQERDMDTRFAVAMAVGNASEDYSEYGQNSTAARKEPPKLRAARSEVAQRLLVGLLRDTDIYWGLAMGGAHPFTDPRICDFANVALSELWPHTYAYHSSASRFERDRECVAMANRWRSAHGLAPLPLPARPHIRPVAASRIQPLLRQFTQAHSVRERHGVETKIVALGLPALSAVHKARQGNAQPALASAWLALEQRLSTIVRSAHVESKGLLPDASLLRQLAAMEGRPLSSSACNDLVENAMETLPEHASGIRFSARREDDGAGFTVLLTFLPSPLAHFRSQTIAAETHVDVRDHSIAGSSGTNYSDERTRKEEWGEIRAGIQKALVSDPYEFVTVQLQREYKPNWK